MLLDGVLVVVFLQLAGAGGGYSLQVVERLDTSITLQFPLTERGGLLLYLPASLSWGSDPPWQADTNTPGF